MVENRNRKLMTDVIKMVIVCLWGILLLGVGGRCENIDQFIVSLIFPLASASEKQYAAEEAQTAGDEEHLNEDEVNGEQSLNEIRISGENSLYEDLEALCEENSEYEYLEAQAENALAMMESENAAWQAQNTQNADAYAAQTAANAAAANPQGIVYSRESLLNYQFLLNTFYVVDSSTSCDRTILQPEVLLDKDLTMDLAGEAPKILIYHTHSQEGFADSVPGDEYGTVLGLGDTLTRILQEKYGVSVYHDRGVYDMIDGQLDRSEAYSMALPVIEQILEENPSIKVVIDLHRDGVNEDTHLVTTVNGKPTAKIMFFNGLCRGATSGENGYIQNPYLMDNLAFSLQMQLKAAELYPDFTRRIYLRAYRFNMHVMPRTLLVECGAQTNTVEEVHNAMEPLADILYGVLSGG